LYAASVAEPVLDSDLESALGSVFDVDADVEVFIEFVSSSFAFSSAALSHLLGFNI